MTATVTAVTPRMVGPAGPLGILRRSGREASYCVTGFLLGLVRFVVLVPLFALGLATGVIVLGVPVLALAMYVARGFADVERSRLQRLRERVVRRPRYKQPTGRGLRRLFTPISEAQSWLDLLHGIVALIPAIIGFVFTVTWWVGGVGCTLYFFWGWSVPQGNGGLPWLLRRYDLPDSYLMQTAVYLVVGLLFLVTAPLVVRAATGVTAGMARAMLTTDRVTALQQQVDDLAGSRDAAVSAEASALRKLERDIHDGPQQRLVRLSMDLSLAQRRMRTDPDGAQPLLADAISQTRETLHELRSLSRGIAPPILADRGLPAALAALAGRSTVPVTVDVTLPDGTRLPDNVENTAYFLVAEALTNVAKHSGAQRCLVTVNRDENLVSVTVHDDGRGGAHVAKGHGLAGLVDRVRAAGGHLDVQSPAGGPTTLSAHLPWGAAAS